VTVNFLAIKQYIEELNGFTLSTSQQETSIHVFASFIPGKPELFPESMHYFNSETVRLIFICFIHVYLDLFIYNYIFTNINN